MNFGTRGNNKFRNTPVVIDGQRFASKREGARYMELRLLERIGEVTNLETQPRYRLEVGGKLICTYVADFRYTNVKGEVVVEDVKSVATKTPVYSIKRKLMLACHGITIAEVF